MKRTLQYLTMAALGVAIPASAHAAEPQTTSPNARVFVSLSAGFQAAPQTLSYRDTDQVFLEEASADARLPGKSAASYDASASVRLVRNLGLGAAVTRFSEEQQAIATLTMPHPLFFNRHGVGTIDRPTEREETAIHLHAVYLPALGDRWRVALMAGPSRFHASQELVSDFRGDLNLNPDLSLRVDLNDIIKKRVEDTAWGYNVGADVMYFFSRNAGLGAVARYSRASVEVENAFETTRTEVARPSVTMDLGGLSVTGGLRIRF
jgi:hypothetical protein